MSTTIFLLTSRRLEVAEYTFPAPRRQEKGRIMDTARRTPEDGPLSGLLRPPLIFVVAILLGIGLSRTWPLPFLPPPLRLLGPVVVLCAVLLFLVSLREFRAAGTSVRGT